MRSVNELPGMGFQNEGDSWVKALAPLTVVAESDPVEYRAAVWPDAPSGTWDRLYIYLTYPGVDDEPWFGFNEAGASVDRGGNLQAVVDAIHAGKEDDDTLTAEDLSMMSAQTYHELTANAEQAAGSILAG